MSEDNGRDTLIRVEGLKKYFTGKGGTVKAVDNVSFSIGKGKTMGLVGESGSGKSTTGRAILRLIRPDAGHVYFGDHEVNDKNIGYYRHKMQIIFQNPSGSLDPYLKVEDIIAEGMRARRMYASKKEEHEAVERLLDRVGLRPEDALRFPGEFSGGQQQRIGIARALAVHPEFIVCDEAVSALDVSYQSQIINTLIDLQESEQIGYLFISHDLSVVSHISDTVGVMYSGRLVESGGCEEIMKHHVHPYTKLLLSAVPIADPVRAKARVRAAADDEEIRSYKGCAFAGRCPVAEAVCREFAPMMTEVAPGHMCACHMVG